MLLWGRFGAVLGRPLGVLGRTFGASRGAKRKQENDFYKNTVQGPFWDRFGTDFGPILGPFLGPFWGRFEGQVGSDLGFSQTGGSIRKVKDNVGKVEEKHRKSTRKA